MEGFGVAGFSGEGMEGAASVQEGTVAGGLGVIEPFLAAGHGGLGAFGGKEATRCLWIGKGAEGVIDAGLGAFEVGRGGAGFKGVDFGGEREAGFGGEGVVV